MSKQQLCMLFLYRIYGMTRIPPQKVKILSYLKAPYHLPTGNVHRSQLYVLVILGYYAFLCKFMEARLGVSFNFRLGYEVYKIMPNQLSPGLFFKLLELGSDFPEEV